MIGLDVVITNVVDLHENIYHSKISNRQQYESPSNRYQTSFLYFFSYICCTICYFIWIECVSIGLLLNTDELRYSYWLELMFSFISAYNEGDIYRAIPIYSCYDHAAHSKYHSIMRYVAISETIYLNWLCSLYFFPLAAYSFHWKDH